FRMRVGHLAEENDCHGGLARVPLDGEGLIAIQSVARRRTKVQIVSVSRRDRERTGCAIKCLNRILPSVLEEERFGTFDRRKGAAQRRLIEAISIMTDFPMPDR